MSRAERVANEIKHKICHIIYTEIKDPRIGFITITGVDVSSDLQNAKVYFSVFGDTKQKEASQNALKAASGFIRKQLGMCIKMRYTPILDFRLDESIEYGQKIEDVFRKIHKEKPETRVQKPEYGNQSSPETSKRIDSH